MDGAGRRRDTLRALAFGLLLGLYALATPAQTVDDVLARETPPPGIVFEFSGNEEAALETALPGLRADVARIRERFGDVPIEVVSHGLELLSLSRENAFFYPAAHAAARALHADGITLTVCGAYADDFDLGREDFPAYVDVVPSAPAHRDNLIALDYLVIAYP